MKRRIASGVEVERLRRQIDDLFALLGAGPTAVAGMVSPAVDLVALPDRLIVRVDLPDVAADGLEISLQNRELSIVGLKGRRDPAPHRRYHQVERSRGPFAVEVLLPALVDPTACRATLRNGLLEVTLPLLYGRADVVHRIPMTEEET